MGPWESNFSNFRTELGPMGTSPTEKSEIFFGQVSFPIQIFGDPTTCSGKGVLFLGPMGPNVSRGMQHLSSNRSK
jgi:hypothetical protein